ncbi:hypothetical protein [Klebsiella quasipneumoniae]|uniref:hypothetical protein n=1 Tax=Klebsiella quasipneumoniae TaxID=1463165 RepID=UPI001FCB6DC0|nr:hypothetical protein [Klebsiella quasipneumoniae]MCJ5248524.1 hypothetical protein [Klebsiella quasipneumoniae]
MKVIKYWKVQLLQLSQPSGNIPGIMNASTLVESLLFEGYSKDKPKINLGSGVNIELFTAPDSLETRIFRDHLVDSVRCFPMCEDDDETDGTQEEQTKPPSREAMIEYIKQAIGEGYQPKICHELISNPDLLWQLHDEAVDYEYRACWNWYQSGHGFHETFSAHEKIHDHSCDNCFADTDVNKARSSSFEDVVKPVIKWLNENANPHTSVSIDATSAQLLTGEIGIHTEEFIKD